MLTVTTGGPFFLYVANIRSARIEVYDTNFHLVNLSDDDNGHAFLDREIPEGFAPFTNCATRPE